MADPIRFYFDFTSAYSYVAINRIGRIGEDYGREIDWACVPLRRILEQREAASPRDQPAKFAHNTTDFPRLCEMNFLPAVFPPPYPAHEATLHRLAFWHLKAKDPERAIRFAVAVSRRAFGEGKEVRTAQQLAAACKADGVPLKVADLKPAEDDPAAAAAMDAALDRALADGMFGAPFMVCDGETFWGADRLEHLEYRLRRRVPVPKGFVPFEFKSNYTARSGPLYVRRTKRDAVFAFRADSRHVNPNNVVHGGWMTSFVDVAMAQSAFAQLGEQGLSPTIQLESNFLAPIRIGQWVECHARLVKATARMHFVEALCTADGEPVLRCSAIYRRPREVRTVG